MDSAISGGFFKVCVTPLKFHKEICLIMNYPYELFNYLSEKIPGPGVELNLENRMADLAWCQHN